MTHYITALDLPTLHRRWIGFDDIFEELNRAIKNGLKLHPKIIIENDFRAHCSPSRQENIKKAAEKLALRLLNLCPECKAPGWGLVDYKRGLPCQMCGLESKEAAHSEILGCTKCNFRKNGKTIYNYYIITV